MLPVGQDLRYGARLLWKFPGFTAIALAALALGMGAATAIFSVVDAVLLKPLPFSNPERLLVLWEKNPSEDKLRLNVAAGNFLEWRKQSQTLESVAAFQDGVHVNLTSGPNGPVEPEELAAERVSAELFPLLGVQPVVGRAFQPEQDQPGRANFALLSFRLWQRRFAGDPAVVGKPIRLRGQIYTVVGVLPAGFQTFDAPADVWIPLGLDPGDSRVMATRSLIVLGRLRPHATLAQARAELDTIGDRLEQSSPALNRGWRPSVFGYRDELLGSVEHELAVLMAAVGFLLLIACVNVANLLLARGTGRRRELAIRTALGAGRFRIVAQLLSESILLSLTGGALGLLLAWGAITLVAAYGPTGIPRLAEARLDWRLFLFALGASLATGILFGIAPAIQSSSANPALSLVEGGRGRTAGRSARLLRNGLVISEVALAVLVLIGAGLLIRSFVRLRSVSPGFQPAGLLTARMPMAGTRHNTAELRTAFLQQTIDRIAALPEVQAVAAVNTLPLTGFGSGSTFAVEGRPAPPPEQRPIGLFRAVTPGYFQTIGIPLLAGRSFAAQDTSEAPLALVVNQTLARRFWPNASAVGGRLVLDPDGRVGEIVGVVGDVKPEKIEDQDWPTVYSPYSHAGSNTMVLTVRTAVPPMSLAGAMQRAMHQIDPDQPLSEIQPMENVLDQAVAGARFNAVVLAVFAQIAFVLAAVGIYGVVSYDVSQRTGEIGIRLALGAQPHDVLRLILGQGALLTGIGIAAGLAAACGLTRLMSTMLFGVTPTDTYTFAAIPLLLGAVALTASYLPSRRAMGLHPAAALRHE